MFDIIEYLYRNVSKPIDGELHSYNDCGMHWETFNKKEGEQIYRKRINEILIHYNKPFELSEEGLLLEKPENGLEKIYEAKLPTDNENIRSKVDHAILSYRKHGSTMEDRRTSIQNLAGVLEQLRPQIKEVLTTSDENDLFNIANNFGIRHQNDKQKTNYDSLWLSWMYYFYLSTIHVVLRKIGKT